MRHLFLLFLALGLIPVILFTLIPALYQTRTSKRVAEEAEGQLQEQTRQNMLQFAEVNAARYDAFFQEKTKTINTFVDSVETILAAPTGYSDVVDWKLNADTHLLDGGWRVNGPDRPVGFLASPLADFDAAAVRRQNGLAAITPSLESLVTVDSQIRSAFVLLEEQVIWLYPNRFWRDGEFLVPPTTDITKRPYYIKGAQNLVWSKPYTTAGMEPIIVVAAPIWAGEQFVGMAGLSFSLQRIATDVLSTQFGERGFVFLTTDEGEVLVMPRYNEISFLSSAHNSDVDATLGRSLLDVVPEEVKAQLEEGDILARLQRQECFVSAIDLPAGPTYLAFAPMENSPWYAVVVQPVEEVSGVASVMAENVDRRMSISRTLLFASGSGFLLVILIGGVITLRGLALPIQELAKGSEAVAQGDLSYRVPVPRDDNEMTALVQRFNGMVGTVQRTQEELEQQKRALEHTLAIRERELEATNQLAALTNLQTDLPNKLKEALKITRDVLELDVTALVVVDEEGAISFSSFVGVPERQNLLKRHSDSCFKNGLAAQVKETKRPLIISDIRQASGSIAPELQAIYELLHVRGLLMEPIESKGRLLGILCFLHSERLAMTEQQCTFISTLAQHIAELIENAQLQDQTRVLSIYNERQHLARELHDSVVQSLFTLNLTAEGLKVDLDDIPPAEAEALEMLTRHIRNIQNEMRTLINELRPIDLQRESLEDALERHIWGYRRSIGGAIDLSIRGKVNQIPYAMQRHLNRITQEALSNVARHARASRAEVKLAVTDEAVCLTIKDDGCGFDPRSVSAEKSWSMGLFNIRERVEMMGGQLSIQSAPAEGTAIVVEIPLAGEDDKKNG